MSADPLELALELLIEVQDPLHVLVDVVPPDGRTRAAWGLLNRLRERTDTGIERILEGK